MKLMTMEELRADMTKKRPAKRTNVTDPDVRMITLKEYLEQRRAMSELISAYT